MHVALTYSTVDMGWNSLVGECAPHRIRVEPTRSRTAGRAPHGFPDCGVWLCPTDIRAAPADRRSGLTQSFHLLNAPQSMVEKRGKRTISRRDADPRTGAVVDRRR